MIRNLNHFSSVCRRTLEIVLIGIIFILFAVQTAAGTGRSATTPIATFSIVGYDPATGELGVAVASRFFAVGSVVPWARADIGAVATQAYANTSFGWRGLEMLEKGLTPEQCRDSLIASDDNPDQRQFGIVDATGRSVTYTGKECIAWAGGRAGQNYAVQGNILAGEDVVTAVEKTFLETEGSLADRLYAALVAGDAKGGDARGKQSAAMLVVKKGAGYGGYTDRAIDIRVDDNPHPFKELGRLLNIAQVNYTWNEAWTLFTQKKFAEALPLMERTAKLAPENGEVFYDLGVIRLAAGDSTGALSALATSFSLNPKLKIQAAKDSDLAALRDNPEFQRLIKTE
jgi:uncharacterized Ntn-hydrolase superfamily protein